MLPARRLVLGRRAATGAIVASLRSAVAAYGRHACSELAAAIAYRILFSLVPFVALLAAALPDDVIDWLLTPFPGTAVETGVEEQLASSGAVTSVAGAVAFAALIWTASGMTRSLRIALAVVWESETRPDFVRAKLRDIAALGVLAALILGVFVVSLVTQVAVQAGDDLTGALGWGSAATILATIAEVVITLAATVAGVVIVYRLGAPVPVALAAVWRSALVIAVAIDVALAAYAFYLVRIAGLDAVYGPLGAVLAFLALVYVAAGLVLFGAELVVISGARRTLTRSG